jgi:hypothetical protein
MSNIWEVPIVDGPSGVQIGVFRMDAGGYDEPSWDAPVETEVHSPAPRVEPIHDLRIMDHGMPAARDHVPLPVNPSLYAKVRLLLETPVATV